MSGTVAAPEGITSPPIDDLLDRTQSKYALVIVAAKRARQINGYYSQLGEGLLEHVGPLVETAPQEKPLSIALREISSDLIEFAPAGELTPLAPVGTDETAVDEFGVPLSVVAELGGDTPADDTSA